MFVVCKIKTNKITLFALNGVYSTKASEAEQTTERNKYFKLNITLFKFPTGWGQAKRCVKCICASVKLLGARGGFNLYLSCRCNSKLFDATLY